MTRYFYTSAHFTTDAIQQEHLMQKPDGSYVDKATNEVYRKRLLFDFGWGQEEGFERIPPLPFSSLINIIETYRRFTVKKRFFHKKSNEFYVNYNTIQFSNFYGAAAVIMQDHVEELIAFLSEKAATDYFSNETIRNNFKVFSFDSKERTERGGNIPGGIGTESYEDVLNKYPQWHLISAQIKALVYNS